MTTPPAGPTQAKPSNWLSRFVKEYGIAAAFFLAAGGTIFAFVIWVSTATIRHDVYIEGNYQAQIQKLEAKLQEQQGKIDAHQKWIDCQERHAKTGKKYVVIGSTYDCVEETEPPKPASALAPGTQ